MSSVWSCVIYTYVTYQGPNPNPNFLLLQDTAWTSLACLLIIKNVFVSDGCFKCSLCTVVLTVCMRW